MTIRRYLPFVLCIVPLLFLISQLMNYMVDLPSPDGRAILSYIDKFHSGKLSFTDLFEQHNEHRLVFPKLILLTTALLTNWNTFVESIINVMFGILIVIFISFQSVKSFKIQGLKHNNWIILVYSLIGFSIMQYENFAYGFQIQILMNILFVLMGFFFLSQRTLTAISILIPIAFGIIATYSFANGLLFWFIGTLPIIYRLWIKDINRVVVIEWILSSIAIVGTYFIGFKSTNDTNGLSNLLHEPINILVYFLTDITSSIVMIDDNKWINTVIGSLAIGLFIFLSLHMIKSKMILTFLPWFLMATYSISSSALKTIGRLDYFASRYATMSNLFWIALIFMVFLIINERIKIFDIYLKIKIVSVISILFGFFIVASTTSIKHFEKEWEMFSYIRYEWLSLGSGIIKETNYKYPYIEPENIPIMIKYNLSMFRNGYLETLWSPFSNRVPITANGTNSFVPQFVDGSKFMSFQPNAEVQFDLLPTDKIATADVRILPEAIGDKKSDGVNFFWEKYSQGEWSVINKVNITDAKLVQFTAEIKGMNKIRLRVDFGDKGDGNWDWSAIKKINIH